MSPHTKETKALTRMDRQCISTDSRTASTNEAARFLQCRWSCERCGDGDVRPWASAGETDQAAARRHTEETRSACVKGCAYIAAPTARR